MTLRKYLEPQFGLDRRDSAVRKESGILFELENLLIDEGALYVRKGFDPLSAAIDAGNKILALARYYGFDANTGEEIKELYAAVNNTIRRFDTPNWTQLALPPGITLTADVNGNRHGEFRQLRDKTYFSNYTDPVLVIKKEDDQIYEAGIPQPDPELVLATCETLDDWTFTTDGSSNFIRAYLDAGFERHTKGDYGITLEQHEADKTLTATYDIGSVTNLEWFFQTATGTADAQSSGGTKLYDANAFTQVMVGQQIKNVDDDSTAVIVELISQHEVRTTELKGGTDNTWQTNDNYIIGAMSTNNDYIAIDIFRFTKIDIDECVLELSSQADFSRGFRAVIYSDTGFEHYDLLQRTMLAEWAMSPYSNKMFNGRFRKSWFIPTNPALDDDWDSIRYIRVKLQQNDESSLEGAARITIDNIRLLKTPPLPSTLRIQVATCDAQEGWTGNVGDDIAHATQGFSCKTIPLGGIASYTFPGSRDFSQYGEGTAVTGADTMVFDIAGSGSVAIMGFFVTMTFQDGLGRTATAVFTPFNDMANLQERHVYIQEFELQDGFDWSDVVKFTIWNGGVDGSGIPTLYIDNIRIQPPSASKVINRFIPLDLILLETIDRGIEHYFGENSVVDNIADWLFATYAKFTRQATGQGSMVYPETKHGRYKVGNALLASSLQINVDAGGSYSVTFNQNTDLTEYENFNFNLEAFLHPRQHEKYTLGVDWVEIPATPEDEFRIWLSTPDWGNITKISFRFYANAEASWVPASSTHAGAEGSNKLYNATADFKGKLGKRIRNEDTGDWGIITWIGGWVLDGGTYKARNLIAWGGSGVLTWGVGDTYSIDAFNFGATGVKPKPDADNYWEYVLEPRRAFKSLELLRKEDTRKALQKYPIENQEIIEGIRTQMKKEGLETIYQENVDGDKWWSGIITWKRKDMIQHNTTSNPWTSLQCIAAHSIIVQASSKKGATINFNDWTMHKKGAVEGEIAYKILLEDEEGYLGPDSEASKVINTSGNEVNIADIYIPYDTRIARKRIYRTDSTGNFRHLDTIDRLDSSYLDNIPEEMLGEPLPEMFYKPPKARIIEPAQNKMAYCDIVDRDGRIRPSRIQLSKAFAPHQCSDDDVFDVLPENGQRITGFRFHLGDYITWKEKSIFSVDPQTFEWMIRDAAHGNIAPRSLDDIPEVGFGWLSHEGVVIGDHTNRNTFTGKLIWDDLKNYSLEVLSKAVGFYYDDYYYLFVGANNERGYALHIPSLQWFYLSNWNIQCVVTLTAGTDLREVYAGTNYGYVNQLFFGNYDYTDDANNTQTVISSVIRTLDYDFDMPGNDKYPRWILIHAKNLVSGLANQAQLIITPQLDQVAGAPYTTITLDKMTYYQHIVEGRHPTIGNEKGTLVGMRITGTGRYALRDILIDAGDLGFRPNLC